MTDTIKENVMKRLHLIEKGETTYTINQTLAANSFNVVRTVNITNMDVNRLQVFEYGHGDLSTTVIPNMGNVGFISGNTLILAYKVVRGQVQIGFVCSGAGFTPTAPFRKILLGYYVMYY